MNNLFLISIHAPRTGSDMLAENIISHMGISIHAPRTGSDHRTHSARCGCNPISIHAPRTGSDIRHLSIRACLI